MKYFTKYLKVEGKATVNGCNQCEIGEVIKIREDNYRYLGNNEFEKVKLFLCTRDIQVGDEIVCDEDISKKAVVESLTSSGLIRLRVNKEFYTEVQNSCFKVIGELSKDAIWITEGMEFEEEDINRQFYDDSGSSESCWFNYNKLHTEEDWAETPEDWKRIQIKCPTCKTFH